jgi:hypothetical protein
LTNEETQDLLQSYDLVSDSFEDNQVIFSVYPNPTNEILHASILGTRLENSLVEMCDAGGKLVYSSSLSNRF